jgi:hypothetical protein
MSNGAPTETELVALRKSVVEALTGADVGVEGISGSRTERLTARGASDVVDRIVARGFKVVRA